MNYRRKKGGQTRVEWRRTNHVWQDTETPRIRVYMKTVRMESNWNGRRSFRTPAKTADSLYGAKRSAGFRHDRKVQPSVHVYRITLTP